MQFDRAKLRDLILYACSRCEPAHMGAVKLNKVLYYSDMLHFADFGRPLTGATYRKRPRGPTCDQVLSALRDLERDGTLKIRDVEYFGYWKKEYMIVNPSGGDSLSSEQQALVDEVVEFVCVNNTAKTISEFSHNTAWESAEYGDELPYHSVFHIFPHDVSEEAMSWALSEAKEIEAARSNSDPVDFESFATFRKRLRIAGVQ